MVKLTKAASERRWFLAHWEGGGWRPVRNGYDGKKWQRHLASLVKARCLEVGDVNLSGFYRITDAGRAALQEKV